MQSWLNINSLSPSVFLFLCSFSFHLSQTRYLFSFIAITALIPPLLSPPPLLSLCPGFLLSFPVLPSPSFTPQCAQYEQWPVWSSAGLRPLCAEHPFHLQHQQCLGRYVTCTLAFTLVWRQRSVQKVAAAMQLCRNESTLPSVHFTFMRIFTQSLTHFLNKLVVCDLDSILYRNKFRVQLFSLYIPCII